MSDPLDPLVVQVWFRMPPGSNATSMGMPAELIAPDRARLRWAPWSALDVAKDDELRVEQEHDGTWWFKEKIAASGYCAIQLWATDDADLEHFDKAALAAFAPLQVSGQGMFGFLVLDVPPTANLSMVRRVLSDGERNGRWTVDELCVTAAWQAAAS